MDENRPADPHPSLAQSEDSATDKSPRIFDNPRNVKRVIRSLVALSVLLIAVDLVLHRHPSFAPGTFPVEGWFGFYAIYGFVACVLLVLIAKQMRKVLMRGEDYYDR